MAEEKTDVRTLVQKLETLRDDVRVRAHLAQGDLRQEIDRLEDKWQHFQSRARQVQDEAGDALKDVRSAVRLLGDELREGYERVKARL